MKTSHTLPLALVLAAAPFWSGPALAQENAAPPDPAAPPQAEDKAPPPGPGPKPDEATSHREGDDGRPAGPEKDRGPRQKSTFLGVGTLPLPDAVAAQLPLEKGTGLLVAFVSKDSPAEKAGVKVNDVLVKLDEHILVNAAQLHTIIDNRKEGDPAALVFYRQGQQKTATATLTAQERPAARHGFSMDDWSDPARTAEFQAALANAREEVERGRREAEREAEEGRREAEEGRREADRGRREADRARREADRHKNDLAVGMESLKAALKGIGQPDGGTTTTFAQPGSAQAITVDDAGTLLLTRQGSVLHLRATDPAGKVSFDGDITSPHDQTKLPPELAARIGKLLRDFPAAPPVPPVPPVAPVPPVPPMPPVPPTPPAPGTNGTF